MAPKKRLTEIDDIRGISIIVMIMIHTNAYYLSIPASFAAVELTQFAVIGFIFCSAYLFFKKQGELLLRDFFSHFWKRVKRLILPYYAFLSAYSLFFFLSQPKKLTASYFVSNLTLTGGIDFNWLVLLFIEFAFLMPFILWLYRNHRRIYILYMALAFVSSVIFLTHTPLPWYRSIMWLPWSLVLGYALHMDDVWKRKWLFVAVTVLLFVLFVLPRQLVLVPLELSLRMYDNKYPPNLYHLAYSMFCFNFIYFLSKAGVFRPVQQFIHFYSINSYSIYFIHLLVIFAVTVFWSFHFNWITFYLAVIGITTVIQLLVNGVSAFLRYRAGPQSEHLPARAS